MPKITDLSRITAAHGVTVSDLAAAYRIRPETLRRWAVTRPETVIAMCHGLTAKAVPVPVAVSTPPDKLTQIRRRATARRWRKRHAAKLRAAADADKAARHAARVASHAAALRHQAAWGLDIQPPSAGALGQAAARWRAMGCDVTAGDLRRVLQGQGHRCAYCGLAGKLWIVRRDHDVAPTLGGLFALCEFHAIDKGQQHDGAYRFEHDIPTPTEWDGL
ncbi:HNH endonuclease [Aeromonas phage BUCT552]|nr:HNH endonuclease [Aeromonas phage BUCT552]